MRGDRVAAFGLSHLVGERFARADVEAGRFSPIIRDVSFSLTEFNRDIDGYNRKLEGVLHGH